MQGPPEPPAETRPLMSTATQGHPADPSADPPPDHGYFGPGSLSWEVFLHPASQVMIAQITNLLEMPHIVFQHVLAHHDPVFGAPPRSRQRQGGPQVTFLERVVRTVSVPAPLLFGSTAEADRAARRLFNYHRPMHGTLADSGDDYAATDADSMLFAAVTIAHAAWLAYENFAYVGGHRVPPFTDEQARQYLSEASYLGALMGAPREQFPTSREELDRYYDSVSDLFRTKPGWAGDRLRALGRLFRPGDGRRARHMAADAALLASEVMSFAAIPARFRRLNGVPVILDPVLRAMYVCWQPLFRRLAADPRWTEKVYDIYRRGDADTTRLLDTALELHRGRAVRELVAPL